MHPVQISGFALTVLIIIVIALLFLVPHDKLFPWRWRKVAEGRELDRSFRRARHQRESHEVGRAVAQDMKKASQDAAHLLGVPVCGGCDHYFPDNYDYIPTCVITPIGPVDWVDGSRERATIPNARSAIAPCGPEGRMFTHYVAPDITEAMEEYDAKENT